MNGDIIACNLLNIIQQSAHVVQSIRKNKDNTTTLLLGIFPQTFGKHIPVPIVQTIKSKYNWSLCNFTFYKDLYKSLQINLYINPGECWFCVGTTLLNQDGTTDTVAPFLAYVMNSVSLSDCFPNKSFWKLSITESWSLESKGPEESLETGIQEWILHSTIE